MSQELDSISQVQNIDLSTVETEYPLLASGIVAAQVQECEWRTEESKKKPGQMNTYLHIKVVTTQPWRSVAFEGREAKEINPGFPITHRNYIGTFVDERDGGKVKPYGEKLIAQLRESAFGRAPAGTRFNPAEMLGQSVMVQLKFEPKPVNKDTGEEYGPRTSISGFVRKAS